MEDILAHRSGYMALYQFSISVCNDVTTPEGTKQGEMIPKLKVQRTLRSRWGTWGMHVF